MKGFLELNENEYTTHPNLWDSKKVVLRTKFVALRVYIKTTGEISFQSLNSMPESLKKKKKSHPKGVEGKKKPN